MFMPSSHHSSETWTARVQMSPSTPGSSLTNEGPAPPRHTSILQTKTISPWARKHTARPHYGLALWWSRLPRYLGSRHRGVLRMGRHCHACIVATLPIYPVDSPLSPTCQESAYVCVCPLLSYSPAYPTNSGVISSYRVTIRNCPVTDYTSSMLFGLITRDAPNERPWQLAQ